MCLSGWLVQRIQSFNIRNESWELRTLMARLRISGESSLTLPLSMWLIILMNEKHQQIKQRSMKESSQSLTSERRRTVQVVVFYNGPQRYHVDSGDVLLVYLGEKRPHDGSIMLDLT